MPNHKSVKVLLSNGAAKPVPEADRAATTATSAPAAASTAGDTAPPDTAATRAVSAALAAHPGSTVAELAEAAKTSRSTAFKALIALEKAGLASRHLGGLHGAKVMPDRWQAGPLTVNDTEPGEPAAQTTGATEGGVSPTRAETQEPDLAAEVGPTTVAGPAGSDSPAAPANASKKVRLPGGKLREMVLDHLRGHPDEEFTPFVLGRHLGHSSGAVANVCDRLVANGTVLETSQKPRRFRFAG
jgi:hypothetical protein